nr:MAG TPA: hypothetical protein [Caudoviricetes sp.]
MYFSSGKFVNIESLLKIAKNRYHYNPRNNKIKLPCITNL